MHESHVRLRQGCRQPRQARLSLAKAAAQEWDTTPTWPDLRREYGEPRQCDIGYIGLRLYAVAFVDRAEGRRIISLRKANRREVNRYAQA